MLSAKLLSRALDNAKCCPCGPFIKSLWQRRLGEQMTPVVRQPFKPRTPEELIALLSTVATAILAVIIVAMLYFGREIFVPIALAILLSFVLAPVVLILQRVHVPRGFAVVNVALLAFALIFAMGSLLATQLTQLAGDLPRYQSTISEKIQSFRDTRAGRGTLERASDMLKDLSKEIDRPKDSGLGHGPNSIANPNGSGARDRRPPFRSKYASLILVRWKTCGR